MFHLKKKEQYHFCLKIKMGVCFTHLIRNEDFQKFENDKVIKI